jgi:hypothetical protein
MKLGEVICDEIVEKLRAGLPQRLAAIQMEKGNDLPVVAPADTSYFVGRLNDFPFSPAIFVMEGPTKFRQEGSHGLMSMSEILVYVYEAGANGPELARRLKRQVRAVIECLFNDEPAERLPTAYQITPSRTVPGPTFQPESQHEWRGWYVVAFDVKQLEQ